MILLRFAQQEDSDIVLRWRNDEQTRLNSFSTDLITKEEHETWFAKSLRNPRCNIFIAVQEDGSRLGVVRFDRRDKSAEISITVAPSCRGKGIGKQIIKRACVEYFQNFDCDNIIAKIKKTNVPSLKIFHDLGFITISEEDNCLITKLDKNAVRD